MNDNFINFYPTPKELFRDITSKLHWWTIDGILEPSAGKGNMVDYILEERLDRNIDCIEINPELQATLKGKNDNKYHTCIPPIPLSEFKGKHTLKEVMTSYYKNTEDIPWNKVDIKICYAYFKLRKKIEPAGYTILWDWLNDHSKSLTILDTVFFEILMSRFTENSYWENIDIYGKKQKVTEKTVRYSSLK